jgi:hypothetical protein
MKTKLIIIIVALTLLPLLSSRGVGADVEKQIPEGMKPYVPSRLEWLAVELNAMYRIDLVEAEGFSVTYIALDAQDTILIYVRYSRKTVREAMNLGIDNARKLVEMATKSRGWDSWVKVRESIVLGDKVGTSPAP